jgi:ribosome-binding ATPase YchF (GTP1/OBG family)
LNDGRAAREVSLTDEEKESAKDLFLLSNKPEIIVLNVDEDSYSPQGIDEITKKYNKLLFSVIPDSDQGSLDSRFHPKGTSFLEAARGNDSKDNIVVICAKIESELSELSEEEQKEYLRGLNLDQSGLERLIQKSYQTLGLISFLTAGEKEVRAWTIKKGISAQLAAGEIHTDFIKKFIKAEIVSYDDFINVNGLKKAREVGKARQEGRDYIMQDGDVVEFKIGT